jgi:hypothetical protein
MGFTMAARCIESQTTLRWWHALPQILWLEQPVTMMEFAGSDIRWQLGLKEV